MYSVAPPFGLFTKYSDFLSNITVSPKKKGLKYQNCGEDTINEINDRKTQFD